MFGLMECSDKQQTRERSEVDTHTHTHTHTHTLGGDTTCETGCSWCWWIDVAAALLCQLGAHSSDSWEPKKFQGTIILSESEGRGALKSRAHLSLSRPALRPQTKHKHTATAWCRESKTHSDEHTVNITVSHRRIIISLMGWMKGCVCKSTVNWC